MDRETFERLKARAAGFARTSLTYLEYEHAAQYRVAADSDVLIALRGFNPEAGMDELHWAANGAGTLIAEIERSSAKTLVSFVPEAWKPLFDARGFAEYGVLREYWINELGEPARPLHACAPIGAEDCAAAAAVTAACRDQSREFHGSRFGSRARTRTHGRPGRGTAPCSPAGKGTRSSASPARSTGTAARREPCCGCANSP